LTKPYIKLHLTSVGPSLNYRWTTLLLFPL